MKRSNAFDTVIDMMPEIGIKMKKASHSAFRDKDYSGTFTIAPYEPEFIEIH